MTTYVEYQLDDDKALWIEIDEENGEGFVRASRDEKGNQIIKAQTKFTEAVQSAKASMLVLLDELEDLPMDEIEITFGLKTTGEAGILAVGKLGMEANYEIKAKWKRKV